MPQVRYIVDDVEKALAFYTSSLGFTVEPQFGPAMAILKLDDLHLWIAGPLASASKPMPNGVKPQPGGRCRIVVTVDNLEETVARLRNQQVAFKNEILDGPSGKQVLCLDPSGNIIELFQPT
jgi:predicted enzyme related to lactoylglutathione lyase